MNERPCAVKSPKTAVADFSFGKPISDERNDHNHDTGDQNSWRLNKTKTNSKPSEDVLKESLSEIFQTPIASAQINVRLVQAPLPLAVKQLRIDEPGGDVPSKSRLRPQHRNEPKHATSRKRGETEQPCLQFRSATC